MVHVFLRLRAFCAIALALFVGWANTVPVDLQTELVGGEWRDYFTMPIVVGNPRELVGRLRE